MRSLLMDISTLPAALKRVTADMSEHTMANDQAFKEQYAQILYGVSKIHTQETLKVIMLVYHELTSKHSRPAELGQGDWVLELQRKKSAKWICRWDDQWLLACSAYSIGTR